MRVRECVIKTIMVLLLPWTLQSQKFVSADPRNSMDYTTSTFLVMVIVKHLHG